MVGGIRDVGLNPALLLIRCGTLGKVNITEANLLFIKFPSISLYQSLLTNREIRI